MLRFGDLFLDESKLELRRGSERIRMQGKPLQVLCELATQSGRTVSNEELLRTVWRNETVTAGSVKRAVRIARKALDDDGESQRTIRTVRGHGYRFVLPVTVAEETALDLFAPDLPPVAAPPRSACTSDGAFASRPSIGRRNALAMIGAELREALGVISRILSDSDDSLQRLLSLASVLGTEFTLDRLAFLAGCDAAILLQPLTTAVAAGIVRYVPSTRLTYRFVHVLVRDALFAALPIDERLHLQQRAGGMAPRRKDVVWRPFAGWHGAHGEKCTRSVEDR